MNTLRQQWPNEIFREATLVSEDQILLFHTDSHLMKFKHLCDQAIAKSTVQAIDSDTEVMEYTKDAVYRSAGSLITAIDHIFLPMTHELHIRYYQ
jgi:acetoin utilization deacetylase AcuC-like enzyme